MRKKRYFRKGDIIIYLFFILFFGVGWSFIGNSKEDIGSSAEIYVNNELKYVYKLTDEEQNYFVPTDIGGVDIKIKDKQIRVTSSNSPLKLNVKRGWIGSPGEVIIGVPDRLIIKVVGKNSQDITNEEIDFIVR